MSKKDAMRDVLKSIAKKEKQILKTRADTTDRTYKQYVLKFIEEMEDIYVNNMESVMDFVSCYNSAREKLLGQLRCFDPDVRVEELWNNRKDWEDWKNYRILGVIIKWSKAHLKKNPNTDPEELVDASELLFSDY